VQTTKSYELVDYPPPTYSDGKVSPRGDGTGRGGRLACMRGGQTSCGWMVPLAAAAAELAAAAASWLLLPLAAAAPLTRLYSTAVVELHPPSLLTACRCLQDFICVCPEVVEEVPVVPTVSAVPTPALTPAPTPAPAAAATAKAGAATGTAGK
jgi:hypothetical protein